MIFAIILFLYYGVYPKTFYFAQFDAVMHDLYGWPGEKYTQHYPGSDMWKEYIKWMKGEAWENITINEDTNRLMIQGPDGGQYTVHKHWWESDIYVVPIE